MVQIKVTPEKLEQAARTIRDAKHQLEHIHKNLYNQTEYICSQWSGATSQRFYQMFRDASPQMFNITQIMNSLEENLLQSAEKFREADQLADLEIGATCKNIPEKSTLEGVKDGFWDGAGKGFGDAWEGFLSLGEGETWANIGNSLIHPIDTLSTMYNVISDSFMRDVWNGNAESMARWGGYALAQIGTGLLGTKGLDKITKLAKGASFTKVTDIAGTMTPRLQPALAGGFAGGAGAIESGISSTVASSGNLGHYLGGLGTYLLFARPSWRTSENDFAEGHPKYREQVAFKDREEVSKYTKGSTRPDFYVEGHSVELKNYDLSTKSRRTNLVNTIVKQVNDRDIHLPLGTKQTIIIDTRGQTVSNEILKEIKAEINRKANTLPEIKIIKEE